VTFPYDGKFLVELSMIIGTHQEIIPFRMVAGKPSSPAPLLIVTAVALMVFFIVLRAIMIKRRRRAGASRERVKVHV
jgi:hypothetical protein